MRVTCADWLTVIAIAAAVLALVTALAAAALAAWLDARARARHAEIVTRLERDSIARLGHLAAEVRGGFDALDRAGAQLSAIARRVVQAGGEHPPEDRTGE